MVIERLQDAVAQADKAHIQIALIALLSLFLQIHRQFCGDDRLDVIGLGQGFQLHIIVQHHKLMLQIGTSEGACLHLCDTACVHVAAQQRTKDNTNAAFALAALADQQKHLLAFGGGNKAVPHKFLQGQDVLRLQKLRQKMQPCHWLRSFWIVGNGQTVPAEILFRTECAVQIIGAVRHMNAVLIQGQLFGAALHPHDIQQICDFLCNPTGHIILDAVIDHLFQAVFIVYSAVDREKRSVYRDHWIFPEKFFAE